MAKLTPKEEKLLIADYHTNKYSQRTLSKKYNISVGTVNKLTKEIEPQNEHLVNAQISILSARSILSDEQMNAIMNTAKDELYNKGLVTNASQLNLVRTMEHLANNKKVEIVKLNNYVDGRLDSQTVDLVEVGLGSDDFKHCQDTIDKASLTLGVNQRHSNSQINVNTQNNNSVANIELNQEIVQQTLENFEDEY